MIVSGCGLEPRLQCGSYGTIRLPQTAFLSHCSWSETKLNGDEVLVKSFQSPGPLHLRSLILLQPAHLLINMFYLEAVEPDRYPLVSSLRPRRQPHPYRKLRRLKHKEEKTNTHNGESHGSI